LLVCRREKQHGKPGNLKKGSSFVTSDNDDTAGLDESGWEEKRRLREVEMERLPAQRVRKASAKRADIDEFVQRQSKRQRRS